MGLNMPSLMFVMIAVPGSLAIDRGPDHHARHAHPERFQRTEHHCTKRIMFQHSERVNQTTTLYFVSKRALQVPQKLKTTYYSILALELVVGLAVRVSGL